LLKRLDTKKVFSTSLQQLEWSSYVKDRSLHRHLALFAACTAQAADWSDTSLSYRYGTKFAEPFNNQDITKNIVNLSHVSGYKYGKNFFSVDLLMSSEGSVGGRSNVGAHEAYAVYRHTLDFGKITGNSNWPSVRYAASAPPSASTTTARPTQATTRRSACWWPARP
jgi:hypothetical protein